MFGKMIADRVHVATSYRGLLRECWRTMRKRARHDPKMRTARKAFYRDAMKAHKANRQLCIDCRFYYLGVGPVA